MGHDRDNLMEFAVATAISAGRVTLESFGSAGVQFKGDGSEVTEADHASEALIRSTIREQFPDHAIFGEEGTDVAGRSGYRWVIDPIDGTRSFASGVPLYGILLALEKDGEVILGCCHFPALADTIIAASGAGCWWNGRSARVSACDRLADARMVTSGLEYWRDWATPRARDGFDRLLGGVRIGRTWGDCFGYSLVATGRAELLADPACGASWDYLPFLVILREAGGRFTNLLGGPVSAWSSALATNGVLHEEARAFWNGVDEDTSLQTQAVISRRIG